MALFDSCIFVPRAGGVPASRQTSRCRSNGDTKLIGSAGSMTPTAVHPSPVRVRDTSPDWQLGAIELGEASPTRGGDEGARGGDGSCGLACSDYVYSTMPRSELRRVLTAANTGVCLVGESSRVLALSQGQAFHR